MSSICFSEAITPHNMIIQSVMHHLVCTESSLLLRVDYYRNLLRHLSRQFKQQVTRLSSMLCERLFGQTKQTRVYAIIRLQRKPFYEHDNTRFFHNNRHLLPHQHQHFERKHYLGTDAPIAYHKQKHIKNWSGTFLSSREKKNNVCRCLIQKYANTNVFNHTRSLCTNQQMDVHMLIHSFKRAHQRQLERGVLLNNYSLRWNRWKKKNSYGYNIFCTSHRNNCLEDLLKTETKNSTVLRELRAQIKCCEFPNCSHIYAQSAGTWYPLCAEHRRLWSNAFDSPVRPSTQQLLSR